MSPARAIALLLLLVAAAAPCAAQPRPRTAATETTAIVLNVRPDGSTTTTFVPAVYRAMTPDELRAEVARLAKSLDEETLEPEQRRDLEQLLRSLEIRIETGTDLDDFIADIARQVSRIRRLPILQPIRYCVLDREELHPIILKKLDTEVPPNYLAGQDTALKLLGALPERANLRDSILDLLSEQIAGFYDDETATLYLMRDFNLSRALGRIIIAHEICHALQDQHFDLSQMPIRDHTNDDRAGAALSVLEGDATVLMQEYAAQTMSGSDLIQFLDALTVSQEALDRAPYILKQQLVFPYTGGSRFLTRLLMISPRNRDLVFRHMPESTEQIIHPDKFTTLDYDGPTTITLDDRAADLGNGWALSFSNVLGQFQVRLLFEAWRQWETGKIASEGWDGDRYNLYKKGNDETLMTWVSVWDTEDDAMEFHDNFSNLMKDRVHRARFREAAFEPGATERQLSSDDLSAGGPVHLRFRASGRTVIVHLSNSADALTTAAVWETSILKESARALGEEARATTRSQVIIEVPSPPER